MNELREYFEGLNGLTKKKDNEDYGGSFPGENSSFQEELNEFFNSGMSYMVQKRFVGTLRSSYSFPERLEFIKLGISGGNIVLYFQPDPEDPFEKYTQVQIPNYMIVNPIASDDNKVLEINLPTNTPSKKTGLEYLIREAK